MSSNSRSSSAFSDSLLVLEESESLEDESLDETSEASSSDLGGFRGAGLEGPGPAGSAAAGAAGFLSQHNPPGNVCGKAIQGIQAVKDFYSADQYRS